MKLKIRLKVFGYMTKRNSKKGTLQKTNRRTMAIIRHMRRSAVSAGRPGGLIREITWKAGRLEVICCQVPFPVFICLSEKNLYIRD